MKALYELTINGLPSTFYRSLYETPTEVGLHCLDSQSNRNIVVLGSDLSPVSAVRFSSDVFSFGYKHVHTLDYLCSFFGGIYNTSSRTMHPKRVLADVLDDGSYLQRSDNKALFKYTSNYMTFYFYSASINETDVSTVNSYALRFSSSYYGGFKAISVGTDIVLVTEKVITRLSPGASNYVWSKNFSSTSINVDVMHQVDANTLLVGFQFVYSPSWRHEFHYINLTTGEATFAYGFQEPSTYGRSYTPVFQVRPLGGVPYLVSQSVYGVRVNLSGSMVIEDMLAQDGTDFGPGDCLGADPSRQGNTLRVVTLPSGAPTIVSNDTTTVSYTACGRYTASPPLLTMAQTGSPVKTFTNITLESVTWAIPALGTTANTVTTTPSTGGLALLCAFTPPVYAFWQDLIRCQEVP